jgi:hypothetical protein
VGPDSGFFRYLEQSNDRVVQEDPECPWLKVVSVITMSGQVPSTSCDPGGRAMPSGTRRCLVSEGPVRGQRHVRSWSPASSLGTVPGCRPSHLVSGFGLSGCGLPHALKPRSAGQRVILTSRKVSGGGLEPAVAWCHKQATCATGQVKVGEGLPVASRSHGLTRGDVPKWEQAFDYECGGIVPRTDRGPGGPRRSGFSLHVTVKVLRPHVSGSR